MTLRTKKSYSGTLRERYPSIVASQLESPSRVGFGRWVDEASMGAVKLGGKVKPSFKQREP